MPARDLGQHQRIDVGEAHVNLLLGPKLHHREQRVVERGHPAHVADHETHLAALPVDCSHGQVTDERGGGRLAAGGDVRLVARAHIDEVLLLVRAPW